MPPPKDPEKFELWRKRNSDSQKKYFSEHPEAIKRLSENALNMPQERKDKISNSLKGHVPWNKGKKGLQVSHNKGKKIHPNGSKAVSESNKRRHGEKSARWKGGMTKLTTAIRLHPKCKEWTRSVLMRDYFCDWFSGIPSHDAVAHHIVRLAILIKKYKIKTLEDALICDELWDINNGVTMSRINHNAYHDIWGKQ